MPKKISAAAIRRDILARHNLVKRGRKTVRVVKTYPITLAMRLLQDLHGKPINELLQSGNEAEVADLLGIHRTTVSHWRKRRGLSRDVNGTV